MQLTFLIALLLTALLILCSAQSSSDAPPGAPPLSAEAQRLEAWVGTWEAEVTMMGATTRGTETCRLDCGGHWLVTEHTGSFLGQPFLGRGLTGFDATRGAYTGVWVDSSGGPMSLYSDGTFSADGKTFTAHVEGVGLDGKPARFEYVSSFPEPRKRSFEVYQLAGAQRELQMSIRYTRR